VVTATPTSAGAGVFALRIPFLLVPRGLSDVDAADKVKLRQGHGKIRLHNAGIHSGTADFYALGGMDRRDAPGPTDLRAVGVQTLPATALGVDDPDDRGVIFAVNTFERWGNPGENEIDVIVDTNQDGAPDFFVVGVDFGLVTTGNPDGTFASFIFDADGNFVDAWNAVAPMNSSTVLLPALASDLGLTPAKGGFDYTAQAFNLFGPGAPDEMEGSGAFDAFAPAQSTGEFVSLSPGERAKARVTGTRGSRWMVVSFDDANGTRQADIIRAVR